MGNIMFGTRCGPIRRWRAAVSGYVDRRLSDTGTQRWWGAWSL